MPATAFLADVHNHFGGTLAHRWQSAAVIGSRSVSSEMAGPAPQFFFAPAQIEKRTEISAGEPMRRIGEAFADYVTFTDAWLVIDHATGRDAFAGRGALVDGDVAPHIDSSVQ